MLVYEHLRQVILLQQSMNFKQKIIQSLTQKSTHLYLSSLLKCLNRLTRCTYDYLTLSKLQQANTGCHQKHYNPSQLSILTFQQRHTKLQYVYRKATKLTTIRHLYTRNCDRKKTKPSLSFCRPTSVSVLWILRSSFCPNAKHGSAGKPRGQFCKRNFLLTCLCTISGFPFDRQISKQPWFGY